MAEVLEECEAKRRGGVSQRKHMAVPQLQSRSSKEALTVPKLTSTRLVFREDNGQGLEWVGAAVEADKASRHAGAGRPSLSPACTSSGQRNEDVGKPRVCLGEEYILCALQKVEAKVDNLSQIHLIQINSSQPIA